MLGSLLMAAALPEAFGEQALLFAASYVALQVGRNAAAASLLHRRHRLRDVFERLVVWSAASGVLWLAGAALDSDQRLLLWIPALALELAAPAAGYWLPGRGRAATTDYDIEGTHFAERCQVFIIIALGESIVVTGATASAAGLTPTVVLCLVVAFVETAALWWLYFGATAEHARVAISTCDDPGRLARDAYTYAHLPIVAGIIATAVGNHLLIAAPHEALDGIGVAMILGGPALYLLGESLFGWRMTGTTNAKRVAVAALLILLVPLGGQISVLLLSLIVASLLLTLVVWELRAPGVGSSLLQRGELVRRSAPSRRGRGRPPAHPATPSAASSASDGVCGRRTTFTGPRTSGMKLLQRVRLPQRDRVHAVDAGLEVGGRAPQRFGDELLLGSGAGAGEHRTEEDVDAGVDHKRVAVVRRGLANRPSHSACPSGSRRLPPA